MLRARLVKHVCDNDDTDDVVQSLVKEGYTFDVAYTSVLKRAIKTLNIVQDEMSLDWIPVHRHWYQAFFLKSFNICGLA